MTQSYKPNIGQLRLRDTLTDDSKTRVLCYSGARAGKTFEFIRAIVMRSLMSPKSRHAIIRKHFSIAKKYIWLDTLPGVIDICFPDIKKTIEINKSDYFYRFDNGSEIWIGGLDDKDRADKILGGEYNTMFFNECSEKTWHAVSTALTRLAKKSEKIINNQPAGYLINKAYFDTNPPAKSHWSYKLFFEGIDPETRIAIRNPDQYDKIHIHPTDNADNLGADFLDELKNLTGAKKLRFYDGIYQDSIQGALWSEAMINASRKKAPDLVRIVVAIDPATTNTADSDETGIVACGRCADGHYYVLDDLSGFYSPNGWAKKAIGSYASLRADRVIGEANNGGDMIEAIVKNIDTNVSYDKVWASRGKMTRAEPVSALYEEGKVHHTREFIDMEYEMTTYTGATGEDSPNRMDALVWAITYLMGNETTNPDKLKGMFY